MVKKIEVLALVISIVVMTILIIFSGQNADSIILLRALVISSIIVLFVFLAKKITANNLDIEIKIKNWEFQRYGLSSNAYFTKPVPVGLILPLLLSFISIGVVKFFAFLQFDSIALPSKAVKKYGQRRYSGIMEWDDALIVFYSLIPLLGLALISKFFAPIIFLEFAKYSWIYVFSNMLPLGKLDGTKMFFGSIPLYVFSWILVIITWPIIF